MSVIEDTNRDLGAAIELHVHQDPEGQVDSNMLLRWCLAPGQAADISQQLAGAEVDNPLILICITNGLEEMDRYLFPLTTEARYVPLRRAGENVIHSTIVWPESDIVPKLLLFTEHDKSEYQIMRLHQPEAEALTEEIKRLNWELESAKSVLTDEKYKPLAPGDTEPEPEVAEADDTIEDLEDVDDLALEDVLEETLEDDEVDEYAAEKQAISDKIQRLNAEINVLNVEYSEIGLTPEQIAKNYRNFELMAQKKSEIAALTGRIEASKLRLEELKANEPHQIIFREKFSSANEYKESSRAADSTIKLNRLPHEGRLIVRTPAAFFAKKPMPWISWLASRYEYGRPARDNCDMRHRALTTLKRWVLGLTLKSLFKLLAVTIIETIYLLICGVLLFLGFRGIDYTALRHPLSTYPATIWEKRHHSRWWFAEEESVVEGRDGKEIPTVHYPARQPVFYFINPPVMTATAVLAAHVWLRDDNMILALIWVSSTLVLGAIALIIGYLASGPIKAWQAKSTAKQALKKQERLEELRRSLELLACDIRPRGASYDEVPKSITLRFAHLKTKVCKPFAQ